MAFLHLTISDQTRVGLIKIVRTSAGAMRQRSKGGTRGQQGDAAWAASP